jgi:hypothetical protein
MVALRNLREFRARLQMRLPVIACIRDARGPGNARVVEQVA